MVLTRQKSKIGTYDIPLPEMKIEVTQCVNRFIGAIATPASFVGTVAIPDLLTSVTMTKTPIPPRPPDPSDLIRSDLIRTIKAAPKTSKLLRKYSCEELYERMDNGLCVICEEQDTPDHYHLKHKRSKIFMMVCDDEPFYDAKELVEPAVETSSALLSQNGEDTLRSIGFEVEEIIASNDVKEVISTDMIPNKESSLEKESRSEVSQQIEQVQYPMSSNLQDFIDLIHLNREEDHANTVTRDKLNLLDCQQLSIPQNDENFSHVSLDSVVTTENSPYLQVYVDSDQEEDPVKTVEKNYISRSKEYQEDSATLFKSSNVAAFSFSQRYSRSHSSNLPFSEMILPDSDRDCTEEKCYNRLSRADRVWEPGGLSTKLESEKCHTHDDTMELTLKLHKMGLQQNTNGVGILDSFSELVHLDRRSFECLSWSINKERVLHGLSNFVMATRVWEPGGISASNRVIKLLQRVQHISFQGIAKEKLHVEMGTQIEGSPSYLSFLKFNSAFDFSASQIGFAVVVLIVHNMAFIEEFEVYNSGQHSGQKHRWWIKEFPWLQRPLEMTCLLLNMSFVDSVGFKAYEKGMTEVLMGNLRYSIALEVARATCSFAADLTSRATTDLGHLLLKDLNTLLIHINTNLSQVQVQRKRKLNIAPWLLTYNETRRRAQIVNLGTWCKHRKSSFSIWHRWRNKDCTSCVLDRVEMLMLQQTIVHTQWKIFQHIYRIINESQEDAPDFDNHEEPLVVDMLLGEDSHITWLFLKVKLRFIYGFLRLPLHTHSEAGFWTQHNGLEQFSGKFKVFHLQRPPELLAHTSTWLKLLVALNLQIMDEEWCKGFISLQESHAVLNYKQVDLVIKGEDEVPLVFTDSLTLIKHSITTGPHAILDKQRFQRHNKSIIKVLAQWKEHPPDYDFLDKLLLIIFEDKDSQRGSIVTGFLVHGFKYRQLGSTISSGSVTISSIGYLIYVFRFGFSKPVL